MDAWDLRGEGRRPSAAQLERARRSSGVARFELNAATGSAARRDSAAWLDTGGFGKGAALREAGRLLAARGIRAAMLNFGGQVLALGGDERGHPWRVPVAHPALRHRPAASLAVRGRSVSTTSQSERAVTVGGRRVGHVLDPRSGEPVPAWGSVTVVAEDPVTADILSTALLVMGADEALRWAERRSDVGVLVLEEQGGRVRPRWNDGLEQYLADNPILTRGG